MDETAQKRLDSLLAYIESDGRICPMPQPWDRLWQMLPGRQRQGSSWNPPPPLILAAWWASSASSKLARLDVHIRYAAEHDALARVDDYLRNLPEDQWAYGDGTETLAEYRHRVALPNPEGEKHGKES